MVLVLLDIKIGLEMTYYISHLLELDGVHCSDEELCRLRNPYLRVAPLLLGLLVQCRGGNARPEEAVNGAGGL